MTREAAMEPEIAKRSKLRPAAKVAGEKLLEGVLGFGQAMQALEVDMTAIIGLREEYKARGLKLSSTAVYVKALEVALREHPEMNSRLEGGELVQYRDCNAGIAVDTPKGLYVVVLREVQNKPLDAINEGVAELLERTRNGKLTLDDFKGGTFTISNMAMLDVDFFTSLVNNFETAIYGFGRTQKKPVVDENDQIVIRPMSYVMININHTATTGVPANKMLKTLAGILENPGKFF